MTKPSRKISKKAMDRLKEKLKNNNHLFTDKPNKNKKTIYKYDESGLETLFSRNVKTGGVLTRAQRRARETAQQDTSEITEEALVAQPTETFERVATPVLVPEASIERPVRTQNRTNVSRTQKKTNTTRVLEITDLETWRQNPLEHPITKKKIKEDNVSFVDIKTDYGKLYFEAFSLIWDNLNIETIEDHDEKIMKDISSFKSKLPDLHCYHVNDDHNFSFDYLFYTSYQKVLETKKEGFFKQHIRDIIQTLPDFLKYVQIYKIISNKMHMFLTSNVKYSVLTNRETVNDFIIQRVNDFLYKFVTLNMGEIENIVLHKQLLTRETFILIRNYLQTMDDIRSIRSYIAIDISSDTLTDIFEMIMEKLLDICRDNNIDLRQYRNVVENLNIGNFIIFTARDLMEIAILNESVQKNEKYKMLNNEEFELEEPMRPFLKQPPPLPKYPKKEDIEETFRKPGQQLSAIDRREIEEIFKTKRKRYFDAKNERDNFATVKKEYETKLREYETKKSSYDKKLDTIQKKSKSPLKIGSKEKTPPNKGKTIAELLRELMGNGVDKCNLDDEGSLSTPFTTDFTPLKDYPLSKLQLVVKIHTRDEDGKIVRTDCGNPIDLYNYIISFYNENKNPIHPLTKKLLTEENIDAIMEKLPFAINDPYIARPIARKNMADSNLFISFINSNDYYTAYVMRNFGGDYSFEDESMHGLDIPIYQICSFPSDIGSEDSIDRTSSGMAYMLDTLFSERRLLHNYNSPYGVIRNNAWSVLAIRTPLIQYKSKDDWITNRVTKKIRTREEIERLFFVLYEELARI